jgi:hypothetical protein
VIVRIQCLSCLREFAYDHVGRGRRRRFCSEACRTTQTAAQNANYRADGRYADRVSKPRAPTIPKVCVVCRRDFLAVDRARQACSQRCGGILAKRNGDAGRRRNAEERRRRMCEQCGAAFVARNPSGQARAGRSHEGRFCSVACHTAYRRRLVCEEAS